MYDEHQKLPMGTTSMQALVFDEPAPDARATHVRVTGQPVPAALEVTIDVAYAGINFKDVMARRGDPGYVDSWPFVPGLEAAGTIRALGADVTGLQVGQRVVAFTGAGGLADVATAAPELVAPVPDGLDLAVAAAAPGALTTALLLVDNLAHLRDGEVVLVHSAAGGVGQAAAQLARSSGARLVLGTVGVHGRVDAARAAGYDAVFVRDGSLRDAIEGATDGHGVDAILDPQGTTMLDLDLQVAAPGARIVLFGNASGGPVGTLPIGRLFAGNASVAGFSLAALADQAPARLAAALATVLDRLVDGSLVVATELGEGLASAAAFHDALAGGYAGGKPIIHVK